MRFYKKIVYSLVFALILFFSSMALDIIPCQTAPVIPNPDYTWTFCNLNPDSQMLLGVSKLYFGFTPSLSMAYLAVLVVSFMFALVILHFITRDKK